MSLFAAVDVGATKTRIEVLSASEEPLRTRILDTPRGSGQPVGRAGKVSLR